MKPAGIPKNEAERVASLSQLHILDTLPEERFDRITRLAQTIFQIPIALITFVDEDRQWFKSRQGLDLSETSRTMSFYAHTILEQDLLIVSDTMLDERFADNPLVTDPPFIRFYAGYPLKSPDGFYVGTLCIIDTTLRKFTQTDTQHLIDLAQIVETEINQIELTQLKQQITASKEALEKATKDQDKVKEELQLAQFSIDKAADLIFRISADGQILYANEAICMHLGYTKQELYKLTLFDLDSNYTPEIWTQDWNTLKRRGAITVDTGYRTKTGITLPIEATFNYVSFHQTESCYLFARDITWRRWAAEELMESEERFHQVISSISDFVYVSELPDYEKPRNQYIAPNVEILTGYSVLEFIADWGFWRTLIHPDDVSIADRQLEKFRAGQHSETEYRIIQADGSIIWVRDSGQVKRDEETQYIIVYGVIRDITEKKLAEDALRDSQEKYSILFQQSNDAVFLHDLEFNILDVNQKALELFEYSRDEILALRLPDLYYSDEKHKIAETFDQMEKGVSVDFPSQLMTKRRNSFPAEISTNSFILNGQQVTQTIIRDITERAQAEAALQKQHKFLRQVIDINPHLIFARDREGRFTLANEAFAKLYNTTVEEILGKTDEDYNLNPKLVEQSRRDDLAVMMTLEEIFIPERQILIENDEKRWWQIIKRPIVDEDQDIARQVLGVVTDITNLKLAEEAVHASEEQLHHVIASISGHIYVTELTPETNQINRYISPNVEWLTGYPVDYFVRDWRFWQSLIHPEDRIVAAEQVERFLNNENSEVEYRLIKANGDTIWVRDSGRVERDEERNQLIVYGVVNDITEEKEAEAVLRAARDQALEANRFKTQLLAKVSHELRTPLTAILGYAEMLEFGIYGTLDDEQTTALNEVIDSGIYLKSLVNELLDQAQLEAGKFKLEMKSFTLTKLVEEIHSRMDVLAQGKGLSFVSTIANDLPDTLIGDAPRIQQILVNLVSNAIKFTEQGKVHLSLLALDSTHWALQVSDTGVGIPPEAQSYIFEPFQQVDGSVTRKFGGSGLGLSIVKQLTSLMDGQIKLESQVGQGSTFTIILPLQLNKGGVE